MYAIQLTDLLTLQRDPVMRMVLIPLLSQESVTVVAGQFDGEALPFACGDKQAAAMIEVIRTRYRRDQVRCYHQAKKAWRQV